MLYLPYYKYKLYSLAFLLSFHAQILSTKSGASLLSFQIVQHHTRSGSVLASIQCLHDTVKVIMEKRDATVVGALGSHQCGLGSIPAQCHLWFEFVVCSHPCSKGFSPSQKTNNLNSNSTRLEDPTENQPKLMRLHLQILQSEAYHLGFCCNLLLFSRKM